jgi:hypothetical protein
MITRRLNKSKLNGQTMKQLLLAVFAASLIGCAEQPPAPVQTANYPYDRYARTAEVWGHPNPVYRSWTTEQLQKRRLDLYGMVTLTQTRNGVPAYIYHGQPLPQQDEIKAIEAELNRRYQAGDKTAELIQFWPDVRRHIASGSRVESL